MQTLKPAEAKNTHTRTHTQDVSKDVQTKLQKAQEAAHLQMNAVKPASYLCLLTLNQPMN